MTLLWFGVSFGFVVRLIRRHGWEYVPLVLLAYGARLYDIDPGQALIWDGLALSTMAGIWIVTRGEMALREA